MSRIVMAFIGRQFGIIQRMPRCAICAKNPTFFLPAIKYSFQNHSSDLNHGTRKNVTPLGEKEFRRARASVFSTAANHAKMFRIFLLSRVSRERDARTLRGH